MRMKKRRKRRFLKIISLLMALTFLFLVFDFHYRKKPDCIIKSFAKQKGIDEGEWPVELKELLKRNPETKDFVLNYPIKKNMDFQIDLSEYIDSNKVPLLLQWDERWGYKEYAGELMGLSGCGPTCLSMVLIYLHNDAKYSPSYVADFAKENGYSVQKSGSAWSLIYEGGEKLGLKVEELSLSEEKIIKNLKDNNPIICIMGAGQFTTSGHFIIMTEYNDGYVTVNDPNSVKNSNKKWQLKEILDEAKNMWVCKK